MASKGNAFTVGHSWCVIWTNNLTSLTGTDAPCMQQKKIELLGLVQEWPDRHRV